MRPNPQVATPAAPSPQLLGLLQLPPGSPAPAVRAALNKPDGYAGWVRWMGTLRGEAEWDGYAAIGPELVRWTLDAGGDAMLAVPGSGKSLPLHLAARYSRSPAVVALLLARGPAGSVRAKNVAGNTPLRLAEFNRGPGAGKIKALLETHQEFAKCAEAASCPRLVPRKETKPPLDLSWMCTTDAFQGFRKMTHFPTVALAVSLSNELDGGKVYDAPAGWHWATAAEIAMTWVSVEAVPGWEEKKRQGRLTRNYCVRGGWTGHRWEGVQCSEGVRFAFRLAEAPTADLTRCVHADIREGTVTKSCYFFRPSWYSLRGEAVKDVGFVARAIRRSWTSTFAGIVCIQD